MLRRICFDHECPYKVNGRDKKDDRTCDLYDLSPPFGPQLKINAKSKMDQRREQYVDMPRPHEDPELLRDRILVRKVGAHIASGCCKHEEAYDPDSKMYPPKRHSCTILTRVARI